MHFKQNKLLKHNFQFKSFFPSPKIQENCVDQINKNLEYWGVQKEIEDLEKKCPFLEETKDVLDEIKESGSSDYKETFSNFSV